MPPTMKVGGIMQFFAMISVATLGRLLAASHHDLAGADGLDDLELGEHADGCVSLRAVAGDHDNHRCGARTRADSG